MGFDFPPDVTVQGGVHYLRLIEEDSARNGKFYKISANTDRSISLSNTFSEDLSLVFSCKLDDRSFSSLDFG